MACELIGAKLVAPYFGGSLYVWASVLAVTLGGLAAGYFLGGSFSKKYDNRKLLFYVLLLAGIFLFVALLRSGPSEYYYFSEIVSHRSPHRDFIREELKKIPQEASVFTHNNLIAQIANRREVHQFNYSPHPNKVEMARELKTDYVIFEREFWELGTEPLEEALKDLKGLGYRSELERDGFYILEERIAE